MQDVFFHKSGLGNDAGIEPRNAVFKIEAPKLALAAARKAITDWGGDKHRITHVIGVTCTGVIVPGLEFELMTGLGLSTDTERLGIVYMGKCGFVWLFGGFQLCCCKQLFSHLVSFVFYIAQQQVASDF